MNPFSALMKKRDWAASPPGTGGGNGAAGGDGCFDGGGVGACWRLHARALASSRTSDRTQTGTCFGGA